MCTLNHSGEINCIHTSRSWENYIKNDYLHLFSNFSMNQPISYEYARFWASELNISIVNNHLHGWTTFPWRFSRLDLRRFGDLYQRMKTVFKIFGMGLGADLSKFQAIYIIDGESLLTRGRDIVMNQHSLSKNFNVYGVFGFQTNEYGIHF